MMRVLAIYCRPRLLVVACMGFASGLPLALTGATFAARCTEAHVSLQSIGLLALIQLSYNFKPLWAPFVDRAALPLLTRMLGRRRSWLVLIALLLTAAIIGMGFADPTVDAWTAAAWAVLVAFLSATQDIVIDAYRVEILEPVEQGAGAAATQFGYQMGMIASGAGAFYLASFFGWQAAYFGMAGLMLLGVLIALIAPEPTPPPVDAVPRSVVGTVVAPFRDFALRRNWIILLLFAVLYKLGAAMSGHLAVPFYLGLGFSKIEIANISKVLGVVASIVGVALGGTVVYRFGVMRSLLICGLLQMVSNLLYLAQAWAGHEVAMLALTISLENIAGGMGSATFVAYLSGLCSPAYTATQYALLSAVALIGRNLFAAASGVLAAALGWFGFFFLCALLALPGLALLIWMRRDEARI